MAQIKITLVNSPIGRIPAQRKTVKALGLGTVSYTHLTLPTKA